MTTTDTPDPATDTTPDTFFMEIAFYDHNAFIECGRENDGVEYAAWEIKNDGLTAIERRLRELEAQSEQDRRMRSNACAAVVLAKERIAELEANQKANLEIKKSLHEKNKQLEADYKQRIENLKGKIDECLSEADMAQYGNWCSVEVLAQKILEICTGTRETK